MNAEKIMRDYYWWAVIFLILAIIFSLLGNNGFALFYGGAGIVFAAVSFACGRYITQKQKCKEE